MLIGVPQSTALGLVLFLLYANNLPGRLSSSVSLYADDIKVWRKMESIGGTCRKYLNGLEFDRYR